MELEFKRVYVLVFVLVLCPLCLYRQMTAICSNVMEMMERCDCSCPYFEGMRVKEVMYKDVIVYICSCRSRSTRSSSDTRSSASSTGRPPSLSWTGT